MNTTNHADLAQDTMAQPVRFPWNHLGIKALIVVCAAISTGIGWRMRGDGIYGGSQGVFMVGAILFSFMMIVFAEWKRWIPAMIGVMALLFAASTAGWGTFISQLAGAFGYYDADGMYQTVPVSPVAGYLWLFILGMGWVPLLGFIIAVFFSEKQYRLRDFGVVIAIIIGCTLFGSLFLAHLVAPLISPEAVQIFSEAVAPQSPWEYYVVNFNPFAEDHLVDIPAGRNYHSMISNFSSALESLGVWAYFRFLKKDRQSARISISIALIMGFCIAVMGIWQAWGLGCSYPTPSCTPPMKIAQEHWSLWEFFTGFCFGGLLLFFLINLPKTTYTSSCNLTQSFIPEKMQSKANTLFAILLVAVGSPLLALKDGIGRLENAPDSTLFVVIIGMIFLILYGLSRKTWLPKFWATHQLSTRTIGWLFYTYCLGIAAILFILTPPPIDYSNLRYTDAFVLYGTPLVLILTGILTRLLEKSAELK